MKIRPTINKIWLDRRASKPHWYCRIVGGWGVNREEIIGSAYGCCRLTARFKAGRAYRKARRAFLKSFKQGS